MPPNTDTKKSETDKSLMSLTRQLSWPAPPLSLRQLAIDPEGWREGGK